MKFSHIISAASAAFCSNGQRHTVAVQHTAQVHTPGTGALQAYPAIDDFFGVEYKMYGIKAVEEDPKSEPWVHFYDNLTVACIPKESDVRKYNSIDDLSPEHETIIVAQQQKAMTVPKQSPMMAAFDFVLTKLGKKLIVRRTQQFNMKEWIYGSPEKEQINMYYPARENDSIEQIRSIFEQNGLEKDERLIHRYQNENRLWYENRDDYMREKKLNDDADKIANEAKILDEAEKAGRFAVRMLNEGTGTEKPRIGQKIRINMVGYLQDGTEIDSNRATGEMTISAGEGMVIKCWDEALMQMVKGQKAKVTCPSEMAFGKQDHFQIPGNVTLIYEIELVGF